MLTVVVLEIYFSLGVQWPDPLTLGKLHNSVWLGCFRRLCKNLRKSLRGIFYVPLLFFSHDQIVPVWVSLSICMENLFSQNIHDEDSMLGVLILCHLLDKKFSATSL